MPALDGTEVFVCDKCGAFGLTGAPEMSPGFLELDAQLAAEDMLPETTDYDLVTCKRRFRDDGAEIAIYEDDYLALSDEEVDEMVAVADTAAQIDWLAEHNIRFRIWLPGERWPDGYLEPEVTSWGG